MPKEDVKRDNAMTIAIIGLIGTLIAALLGSPLLMELVNNEQVTETPPAAITVTPGFTDQSLIFREDFDSDNVSGFSYDIGQWIISKDRSNQVLEGDAAASSPDTIAMVTFGPSDFSNGIIEFRIRINQFASETAASLRFRYTSQSTYSLSFSQNQIALGYRDMQNDWILEPFNNEASRTFLFEQGIWYLVRLEARGSQFTVFIDNNRLFNTSDNRLQKGGLNFSLNPGYQAMFDDVKVWELK